MNRFVMMAIRKDDSLQSISVQLDGTKTKPVDGDNYAMLLDTWEVDNSKVITWINNYVMPSIGAQLTKYDSAKGVCGHLARLYTQSNFAEQYQLETNIRSLQQNDMSIQEFYSAMSILWVQLALTEPPELSHPDNGGNSGMQHNDQS
ncbi:gag-pol polyprotein [Tanacetum coccineum]